MLGDPSPEPIYTAVGMALSRWEEVEKTRSRIFSKVTDLDYMFALEIYGDQPTTKSKLKLIQVAGRARFKQEPAFFCFLKCIINLCGKFAELALHDPQVVLFCPTMAR
jgi:hypothetical protein